MPEAYKHRACSTQVFGVKISALKLLKDNVSVPTSSLDQAQITSVMLTRIEQLRHYVSKGDNMVASL